LAASSECRPNCRPFIARWLKRPSSKVVTDEIRAVVEAVCPKLLSKLSPTLEKMFLKLRRMGSQPHLQAACGSPSDRRSGWTDALFRGRSDRLQGTLTKTLGIALADLRQHDNALGEAMVTRLQELTGVALP
jgi:hypothetical protein